MKTNCIHISELFGKDICEKRIEQIARELAKIPAFSSRVQTILGKKNKIHRAESLAGLYLLSRCADIPTNARLATESGGKPYFDGCDIFFNISHSDGFCICATDTKPLGVDVERLRALADRDKLAERYFCAEEKEFIQESDDPDLAFLRVWTKKEALLKCIGVGLTQDLRSLNIFDKKLRFSELTKEVGNEKFLISICLSIDT